MQTSHEIATTDFQQLNVVLDDLVKKFGVRRTVVLLKNVGSNTSLTINHVKKMESIKNYLVTKSIDIFHLERDEFYTNESADYRQARMACYHLFSVYTNCNQNNIGKVFNGRSKRSIQYFCLKCKECLEVPQFNTEFIEKYNRLDKSILAFIGTFK